MQKDDNLFTPLTLTEEEEDELFDLKAKQNLTELELKRLQELLDRYWQKYFLNK